MIALDCLGHIRARFSCRSSNTSHDGHIKALIDAIRQLMVPPEIKKRKIGFLVKEKAARYG
ncbi:MAG: hypothetical protein O7B35_06950 [Deltaproteobacteria bacterium]|nr:hypothetical protein [Deltaproteobacteria bacterium]